MIVKLVGTSKRKPRSPGVGPQGRSFLFGKRTCSAKRWARSWFPHMQIVPEAPVGFGTATTPHICPENWRFNPGVAWKRTGRRCRSSGTASLLSPRLLFAEKLSASRTFTSPDLDSENSVFDPAAIDQTVSTIHFWPVRPAPSPLDRATCRCVPAYATTVYHKYLIRRQRDLARSDRPTT